MAITISTQPKSTTVKQGAITGSLTVAAAGEDSLTYQWYQAEIADSTDNAKEISGATTASYTIPTSLTTGQYHYFCEVRGGSSPAVKSNIATVTVQMGDIPEIPERITGAFVNDFVGIMSAESQKRYQDYLKLKGIEIPDDDKPLRSAQLEAFMRSV